MRRLKLGVTGVGVLVAVLAAWPARGSAPVDFGCVGIERPIHPGLNTGELREALETYEAPPGGPGWRERECVLRGWSAVAYWEWFRASLRHTELRAAHGDHAAAVRASARALDERRAVALAHTRDWLHFREVVALDRAAAGPEAAPGPDPAEAEARCQQLSGRDTGSRCPGARREFRRARAVDARAPLPGPPGKVVYRDASSGTARVRTRDGDTALPGHSTVDAVDPVAWLDDGTLLVRRTRRGIREVALVDPEERRGDMVLSSGPVDLPVAVPAAAAVYLLSELRLAVARVGEPPTLVRMEEDWRTTWFSVDRDGRSLVGTRLSDGALYRGDLVVRDGETWLENIIVLDSDVVQSPTRPVFAASGRVVFFARSPVDGGEWAVWEWGYGASRPWLLLDGVALPERRGPAVSPDGARVGVCLPGTDMGEGLKVVHLTEAGRVSAVPGSDGCLDPVFSVEHGELALTWSAPSWVGPAPRTLGRHVVEEDGIVEQ